MTELAVDCDMMDEAFEAAKATTAVGLDHQKRATRKPTSLQSKLEAAMLPLDTTAFQSMTRILALAGVPISDDATPEQAASKLEAFVRKQKQTKRVVKSKTKQLRAAASKEKAFRNAAKAAGMAASASGGKVDKASAAAIAAAVAQLTEDATSDKSKPAKPKSYMLFASHMRDTVKELKFGDQGKKLGEMWRALSDKERATYKERGECLAQVVAKGGVEFTWPRGDLNDMPIEELEQHWRANLASITHDRSRLGEWTKGSLRTVLETFYGAELLETRKDTFKQLIKELQAQ